MYQLSTFLKSCVGKLPGLPLSYPPCDFLENSAGGRHLAKRRISAPKVFMWGLLMAQGILSNTLLASQCCAAPHLPPAQTQGLVLENSFLVALSRVNGRCKSTLQRSGSLRHECKWEDHGKCSLPVLQGNPCQRAPPPCKCHTAFFTLCWRKKLP